MRPLLIVMCGLPGSGKSTLSRGLAQQLGALRWDKDEVRHVLFPPQFHEHDRSINDLCMELLYTAALRVFARQPAETSRIILDGRPYALVAQRARAREIAELAGTDIVFVWCKAALEVLAARVAVDTHVATDRDEALLQRLAIAWEPMDGEEIAIDTRELDPQSAVNYCLEQLRARGLI